MDENNKIPYFDTDAAWAKVSKRIDAYEAEHSPAPKLTFGSSRLLYYSLALAAGLLLLAGIVSLVRWIALPPAPQMIFSLHGSTTDTLPDGSIVNLSKGSWISYDPGSFSGKRSLRLYGEGIFRVRHDSLHAFTVKGEKSEARVLGTVFDYTARVMSPDMVSVAEGRVRFSGLQEKGDSGSVVLEAGKKGILKKGANGSPYVEPMQGGEMFWYDNRLVFRDYPLAKVIPVLNSAYKTNILASDSAVLKLRLTASFREENIKPVLEVISSTFNLELSLQDSTWYLKRKGCEK